MSKRKKKFSSEKRRCVLCNRVLFQFEDNYVTGATGRIVCSDCLDTSKKLFAPNQQPTSCENSAPKSAAKVLTPQEIIYQLDKAIIGQNRAKRAIAVAIWKQLLRAVGDTTVPRTNLLLYGPTGCGKTALVREAAKIADLPFVNFDATTLSETDYRGRDAQDMVKDLMDRFHDHPKLSNGIILLDEVDKLAARGGDIRTEYNRGTQHALLKLVEGVTITQETTTLSTDTLLFIFSGAFTGLKQEKRCFRPVQPIGFMRSPMNSASETSTSDISTDAFVSFGMEPELLGRVGQYIPLSPLTAKELQHILLESNLSLYLQYQRFFKAKGYSLEFSSQYIDKLVDAALKCGTGARGLNNLVEAAVEPLLFKLAAGTLHKSIRTEDFSYVGR